jgi:hypothetical protein
MLVAIHHYSKWCETKLIKQHNSTIVAKFLDEEIICRFKIPSCVLIDNGEEWMVKFDTLCNNHGIIHQFTAP